MSNNKNVSITRHNLFNTPLLGAKLINILSTKNLVTSILVLTLLLASFSLISPKLISTAAPFPSNDFDGDGIINSIDLDDDNDGILDSVECPALATNKNKTFFDYEEDLLQSNFHAMIAKTQSGYAVYGFAIDAPSALGSYLVPTSVTAANGFTCTGKLLNAATASINLNDNQTFFLTTDGLWAYGPEGVAINNSLTTSRTMQKIAMPTGIAPTDVANMMATPDSLTILTNSGDVWVNTIAKESIYGDGSTVANTAWHKAALPEPVISVRTWVGNAIALSASGNVYTWGEFMYDGVSPTIYGNADTRLPYKQNLSLPGGVKIVQIAISGYSIYPTYYALGDNGKVYVLGSNNSGHAGVGSLDTVTKWTTVKNKTGTGDLLDIRFITAQDQDDHWSSAAAIDKDGKLWSWGNNDTGMIGVGVAYTTLPMNPTGLDGKIINYVETGGHLTPVTTTDGFYCNTGHNVIGGFGDGTSLSRTQYECFKISGEVLSALSLFCDDDKDGIPNHLDLDNDNDTIPDNIEAQATVGYIPVTYDANGKILVGPTGIPLAYNQTTGIIPQDTDKDGIPDYLDLNSDNEGKPDIAEIGNGALDTDGDGRTNNAVGNNGLDNTKESLDTYIDPNGIINQPLTLPNTQNTTTQEVDYREIPKVNVPPIARDDSYVTKQNIAIVINPLSLDTDADVADVLKITEINGVVLTPSIAQTITVPNGKVTIDTAGKITFTPNTGFLGQTDFPYKISDGQGGTAIATQTIDIVNAADDINSTAVNTPITYAPMANDGVPSGTKINTINGVLVTVGVPIKFPGGTVIVNADGTVKVTPNTNVVGTISFIYETISSTGAKASATDYIEIAAPQDAVCSLTNSKEEYSWYRSDTLKNPTIITSGATEVITSDAQYYYRDISVTVKNSSPTETLYNVKYPVMNMYAQYDSASKYPTATTQGTGFYPGSFDSNTLTWNFPQEQGLVSSTPGSTFELMNSAANPTGSAFALEAVNTLPNYATNYLTNISINPTNTQQATQLVPVYNLPNLAPGQTAVINIKLKTEARIPNFVNGVSIKNFGWFWDDVVIAQRENCKPSLDLIKASTLVDTNNNGYTDLGDKINYTFTVKNTGNTNLTNVNITDTKVTVTGGPLTNLPIGITDSTTFKATYILTQADIDAGKVDNSATVKGTDPRGTIAQDISDSTDQAKTGLDDPTTTLLIPKAFNDNKEIKINTSITYAPMSNDILPTGSKVTSINGIPVTVGIAIPVTGGSVIVNADGTFTVTPTNGSLTSIIFPYEVTTPLGTKVTATDTILIVNAVDDTKSTPFNTPITYKPLENDVVQDGSEITMINGQTVTFGTPINVTGGTVTVNLDGTVTVTPNPTFVGKIVFPYEVTTPYGTKLTATDTITITGTPAIEIIKTSIVNDTNANGYSDAGDTIKYTFTVKNTGTLPLTNVTISDNKCSPVTGSPIASLAIGSSNNTATCTYTITPTDILAGKVENTATATGTDPSGATTSDISDDGNDPTKPGLADPTISLLIPKAIDDTKTTVFNTPVTYNPMTNDIVPTGSKITTINGITAVVGTPIVVTNGTVTLNADGTITVTPNSGYVGTIVFPYEVTTPAGVKVTALDTITVTGVGGIELDKVGTYQNNNTIKYTFTVKNTGNLPLTSVTVSDNKCSPVLGGPISLAVGASDTTTFSCIYTVTAADLAAGKVDNIATVTSKDPAGLSITDTSNDPSTTASNDPTIVNIPPVLVDDTKTTLINTAITYNPVTENDKVPTGSKITSIDGKPVTVGTPITVTNGTVTVNADGTVTVTPTNGFVGDIKFSYEVTTPQGLKSTANDTITITGVGAVELIKKSEVIDSNANGYSDSGDNIKYTFTVNNIGTLPLTDITIVDTKCSPIIGSPIATLAIGATNNLAICNYTLTAADIAAGKVENSATVTAKDSSGKTLTDISDDANNQATPGKDDITISLLTPKAIDDIKTTAFNTAITYTPLSNDIIPTGTKVTSINGIAAVVGTPIIVTNGTVTLNLDGTFTVTPTNGFVGDIVFPYEVTTPLGVKVSANDTITVTGVGGINLIKTSTLIDTNANGFSDLGDTIKYSFAVKNIGTLPLTNVIISDNKCSPVTSSPIATLAIGATDTNATCSYTITAADIAIGKVENSATVTAKDPAGLSINDTSDDGNIPATPGAADPTITLLIPKAIDDVKTTPVNTPITYNPMANDTVPTGSVYTNNGTPLPIGTPLPVPNGTITINSDGTVTVTPNTGFVGEIKFPYSITTPAGVTVTANDTITVTGTGAIEIVKSSALVDTNNNGYTDLGDALKYTFTVKNTGPLELSNVTIVDTKCSPITSSPIATLAVGATNNLATCLYTITAADILAGKVENSATATGTDPLGKTISDISDDGNDTTKPGLDDPTISQLIPKAIDDNNTTPYNTPVTYSPTANDIIPTGSKVTSINGIAAVVGTPIIVTNGTVTLNLDGTFTVTPNSGFAGTITFPYEVTTPNGTKVTATDTVTVTGIGAIELLKKSTVIDTNANGYSDATDTIKYTFTVKNTGTLPLNNITITDNKCSPIVGSPIATLAIGALDTSTSCSYTITAADINAGKVENSATATGTDPSGKTVSDISDDANNPATPGLSDPTISLLTPKLIDDTATTPVNTAVTYSPMTNDIVPTNSKVSSIDGKPVTVGVPVVILNGTVTLNSDGTFTVTPNNGFVGDIKFPYEVTTPEGQIVTANDTVTVTGTGSIEIIKTSALVDNNSNGYTDLGDAIKYTFTVKNSGTLPLTNVIISDSKCSPITGSPIAALAVGATNNSATCSYTITAADILAGKVENTATATGTDPAGKSVTDTSDDGNDPTKPGTNDPTISLLIPKAIDDTKSTTVNTPVTYNPLTNDVVPTGSKITAIDGKPVTVGTPIPVTNGTVTVNADGTITVTPNPGYVGDIKFPYEVTTPSGVKVTATDTVTITGTGAIELIKSSVFMDKNGNGTADVGDMIKYTFNVKNTGPLALTNVTIADNKCTPITNLPIATLAIGASNNTPTCDYTITAADLVALKVTNTATATGTTPDGKTVTDISDDGNNPNTPGQEDPTITPLTPTPIFIEAGKLEVIKASQYIDTNNDGQAQAGETIKYTFTVKNTGNVDLTNVVLIDNKCSPIIGGPIATLTIGATDTTTFSCTYALLAEDILAGKVENQAIARGQTPKGVSVVGISDSNDLTKTGLNDVTVTMLPKVIPANPILEVDKAGTLVDTNSNGASEAGETIKYTFTVKNTGNVVLTNVNITDTKCSVVGGPVASMAVGAVDTTTFTCIYTITSADIAAGKVDNQAQVSGTDPSGKVVTDLSNDPKTTTPNDVTSILLTPKLVNDSRVTPFNTPITYSPLLNDIIPAGSKITGINGTPATIGSPIKVPNGTVTVNADGTITVTPDTGFTGVIKFPYEVTTPTGIKLLADEDITVNGKGIVELDKAASYTDANSDGKLGLGETVKYAFTVKNTGNTILTNVTVTDPMTGIVMMGSPIPSLAPGATNSTAYYATYIVTQADLDKGMVINQATVSGLDPQGNVVKDLSNDPSTTFAKDPTLLLIPKPPILVPVPTPVPTPCPACPQLPATSNCSNCPSPCAGMNGCNNGCNTGCCMKLSEIKNITNTNTVTITGGSAPMIAPVYNYNNVFNSDIKFTQGAITFDFSPVTNNYYR
jgi:Bacterial Ig domain/Cadherin-like domain